MGSMQQRMIVTGCALLGAVACAGGDSRADSAASAPASGLGTSVSTSAPLAGFGADVPAGAIPGSQGARPTAAAATTTGSQNAPDAGSTGRAAGSASSNAAGSADANATSSRAPGTNAPSGTNSPVTNASGSKAPATKAPGTSAPATNAPATNAPAPNSPTGGAQPTPLAADEISAATGVFTVAQADRGRDLYANRCTQCHVASQHAGGRFAATWNTRRVFDLYDLLHNTMPLDDPGSLSPQEYVDVVAYVLQLNGHPAGARALEPDPATLRKLRIDIRSSAVP